MSASATPAMRRFRWPKTVIARFVARRTVRSAAFLGAILGAFAASKGLGYATTYPTIPERQTIAATLGNNIGIMAIFGQPHNLETAAGFMVWNVLGVMALVGAVWALLMATRVFRGEETAGRWEMLLCGQTTARRAALNTLLGLGSSLFALFAVVSLTFFGIGKSHSFNYGLQPALFFGLAAIAGAALFMALGASLSQLMPTRSRAATVGTAIFGVAFLVRSAADTTSAHWLLNLTPFGWIEKLQPLNGSRPLWLLPIAGLIMVLVAFTLWLAGRRDLGASFVADKDTAKPHTSLLGGPLALAIRLRRAATAGWLLGAALMGFFFGVLTESAAQSFGASATAQNVVSRLTGATAHDFGATTYLGIVFFMIMILLMSYVASAVGSLREEEAEGYLDNLLVQPVSRLRWLGGRLLMIVVVVVLAAGLAASAAWIGQASQHAGVAFTALIKAAANTVPVMILMLGIGVAALGWVPRLTTFVSYGAIAWSFLLEMLRSGLNINHWILDTSILHHVALAPAADPRWGTNLILLWIGVVLIMVGTWRFHIRDLQNE